LHSKASTRRGAPFLFFELLEPPAGIETGDLPITKQPLYQLSRDGAVLRGKTENCNHKPPKPGRQSSVNRFIGLTFTVRVR
jgi:hypothetical protein